MELLVASILSVILSLFALLSSIVIWLNQRRRKEISYAYISGDRYPDSRQLSDEEKDNARVEEIIIRNTGNIPILPTDFVKPITLSFGEKAKIVNFQVVNTSFQMNKDVLVIEIATSNQATIAPLLLNPKEFIWLNFLVVFPGVFSLQTRIVGTTVIPNKNGTWSKQKKRLAH